MADPRKPILRPDRQQQDAARKIAYDHLIACTEKGSRAIGCTGASFVIMGLGIWASELAELDAAATARMLRALADIYDRSSTDTKRARAERKRRAAVDRLFSALDLEMATPDGRT